MAPLFDKYGELHYVKDTGDELILKSLKGQYVSEFQLIALLNLIETLENIGLM